MKIGLISDTHNLLRPEAKRLLTGVARILHAGDICGPAVLNELSEIAPVTAVRGNNDRGEWAMKLPENEAIEIGGVLLYMLHNLYELDLNPRAAGVGVVITGHSHRPLIVQENGVLYVNPGSAGPRRFKLPVSVATIEISNGTAHAELHMLSAEA